MTETIKVEVDDAVARGFRKKPWKGTATRKGRSRKPWRT
jgi:hypothetical protein